MSQRNFYSKADREAQADYFYSTKTETGLTIPEIQELAEREHGWVLSETVAYARYKAGEERHEQGDDTSGDIYLEEWESLGEKPTYEEILAHAKRGADLQKQMRPITYDVERLIRTDLPIFLCFPADFHLGSPHTDYDAFLRTTDLIKSDPRFHMLIVGADQETAFSWFRDASAVLNQVIPPWMQIEAYKQWVDEMLPRIVALCGDNHTDQRLERVLGDIGLVWRDDVPYIRSWGLVTLTVGKIKYTILASHKYKGSSIYHDLQPTFRMMRDINPLADVYVTAHTHQPAYMNGTFYPEVRDDSPRQHFIVTGTFKTGADLYATRNFGNRGTLGVPTLALWPDKHQIAYFDNPEVALDAFGGAR